MYKVQHSTRVENSIRIQSDPLLGAENSAQCIYRPTLYQGREQHSDLVQNSIGSREQCSETLVMNSFGGTENCSKTILKYYIQHTHKKVENISSKTPVLCQG